ncbi:DgyrCDS532 [Dimorphilus gyrociliatus]|uniref:DgyrCDS532 n=1 Tax=Dimorphilus gyrociliatus TaxID=2664684 RepID=A0A7I8V9D4_9ANNE|nr:DgyrCDS532 [Dimorphilus gyrociliatus]
MVLPDADGEIIQLTEKLFVPQREYPDFNFVGRILGPRGMTAKQLEQDTGCKIMVRGKGSMRDKQKEDMNRGKPNWEHLNEELHVLITVEDTENRAKVKLTRAVEEVKKLLIPSPEGEDDLKKMQLMELAIINGTYGAQERQKAILQAAAAAAAQQPFLRPGLSFPHLRATAQPQLLISPPRYPATTLSTGGLVSPNAPPPLMSPTDAASALLYPGTYLNIDPTYGGTATPQSTALIDIAQLQVDGMSPYVH